MKIYRSFFLLLFFGAPFSVVAEDLASIPWSPNSNYQWDVLDTAKRVYIDRSYTFKSVPANYIGLQYLRTENDDKTVTDAYFLNFNVSVDVIVYLAHDNRINPKPSWMADWTDTGSHIITSDATLEIYAKTYPAGKISLGGNAGDSLNSMYSVFIKQNSTNTASTTSTSGNVPVAVNDTATTAINSSVLVSVLTNDTGLSDTPISVSIVSEAANGWLTKQDDSILYYPKYNFTGEDRFSYQIEDADGQTSVAEVRVLVGEETAATTTSSTDTSSASGSTTTSTSTSSNAVPVAVDDTATTAINRSVAVQVLANDSGLKDAPISVSIVTASANGWVTKQADDSILYYPKSNFVGEDSFSYQIKDADGDASVAAVSVVVGDQQTSNGSTTSSGSTSSSRLLNVSWSHSDIDNVDGYILYRGSAPWNATEQIADISTSDSSIDPSNPSVQFDAAADLGLQPGDQVCFKTRAYNAYGVSLPSSAACTDI